MNTSPDVHEVESGEQAKIREMTRRIVERFDPVKVILFGSHARGDARKDSDVDLLVVLDEINDKWQTTVDVRKQLRGVGIAFDVIVTTPGELALRGEQPGSILRPAVREGRVLHAR